MVAQTSFWDFRYPQSTDHVRLWEHIQALADDMEAKLEAMRKGTATPLDTVGGSTASASYVAVGGAAGGTSFVAPWTGKVCIAFSAQLNNSGANWSLHTIEVRTGTTLGAGTVVLAGSDNRCLRHELASVASHSRTAFLSGLTAGADYNVQFLHRANGVTAFIGNREIVVSPVW